MKKLKIGVFGAGRGVNLSKNFMLLNCEIVAVCDYHKERLEASKKTVGNDVPLYDNFNDFIEHEMDAVIVANDFHEHAPFVIECFKRNLHVFCECISNQTMAEGVALIREFEKSKSIFMLAENYPDMIFNREMKRIVDSGNLGKVLYAEGEYNHPVSAYDKKFMKTYNYYPEHWRNFLPRSYYVTHSLGPLMYITGAVPVRVTAMPVFAPETPDMLMGLDVGDRAAIITCLNNDDSVFRVTGCAAFGSHENSYRICGVKGQIENLRDGSERILLSYNKWDSQKNQASSICYMPEWNDKDDKMIELAGHGGSDFLVIREFFECIEQSKQPFFDVYCATTMASVAILSHRSLLERGVPYDIPDFHKEEELTKYEDDTLSPFYGDDGTPPTLPCCSHPEFKPSKKDIENYKNIIS